MQKTALITGITGQDGSYLAEFLLEQGYEVHGLVRRHSISNTSRIDHIIQSDYNKVKFFLHFADTTDSSNLMRLIAEIRPTEVYNLAAQSHVGISFDVPEYTAEATGVSTLKLLEAIRVNGGNCRYYQASTSELFGGLPETAPQNEVRHFIRKAPMVRRSCTLTGSPSITGNPTICLPVTVYCLTMNRQGGERTSSQGRLPLPLPISLQVIRRSFPLAI